MKNRPKEKIVTMSLRLTPEQRAKIDKVAADFQRDTGIPTNASAILRKLINDLAA